MRARSWQKCLASIGCSHATRPCSTSPRSLTPTNSQACPASTLACVSVQRFRSSVHSSASSQAGLRPSRPQLFDIFRSWTAATFCNTRHSSETTKLPGSKIPPGHAGQFYVPQASRPWQFVFHKHLPEIPRACARQHVSPYSRALTAPTAPIHSPCSRSPDRVRPTQTNPRSHHSPLSSFSAWMHASTPLCRTYVLTCCAGAALNLSRILGPLLQTAAMKPADKSALSRALQCCLSLSTTGLFLLENCLTSRTQPKIANSEHVAPLPKTTQQLGFRCPAGSEV